MLISRRGVNHDIERKPTESTDEMMDTAHITRAIFHSKTGVPPIVMDKET